MITQNIRVPEQGMGDVWAQVSGCRTMGERLQGLLDTGGHRRPRRRGARALGEGDA